LAAAIIVILPAVYQNRKLREHPANAPILDLSLAAIFGTIVFAYFMVREFPIGIELAIDSSPSPSLMSFSTLVIFVLILVPIFSREASLWGKEKVTEVKIAAKAKFHRFSKCSILGSLWCLAASVLPLACIVETEEDVIISSFISPSFEFNYVAEEAAFSGDLGDWMTISWDVHSVDDLMSYFALVVFQLIFAFYVLRYLRGITSRRRVMQLGILAVFIPFIYCLVTVSNPTMMPFTVAFPLPFVSLLGLLGLRFATPNEPSIERDGRHEYPETTLDDLRIQVPVIYYIKSRLMSWLRKSPKSEAE
jgi:hypothetical protein